MVLSLTQALFSSPSTLYADRLASSRGAGPRGLEQTPSGQPSEDKAVRGVDSVAFSPEARLAAEQHEASGALVSTGAAGAGQDPASAQAIEGEPRQGQEQHDQTHQDTEHTSDEQAKAESGAAVGTDGKPLSEGEQEQVEELAARDAEVRAHELAHKAAAGAYARGGPTYSYQTGPDGKKYAVGGSVQIDTSPVPGDPQATIQKMDTVRRAALAPNEPSAQDRRVAADATQKAAAARAELHQSNAVAPGEQTEASDEAAAAEQTGPGATAASNAEQAPGSAIGSGFTTGKAPQARAPFDVFA